MHIAHDHPPKKNWELFMYCAQLPCGNDTTYLALRRRYLIASSPYSFRIIKGGILQRDGAFTLARRRNALRENSIDSRSMEDVVEIVPLHVIYGGTVARSTP